MLLEGKAGVCKKSTPCTLVKILKIMDGPLVEKLSQLINKTCKIFLPQQNLIIYVQ